MKRGLLVGCFCAVASACAKPPVSPPAPAASPSPEAPSPEGRTEPLARARHRPLHVSSACGDVVTVVFADDPRKSSAGGRTIAPSSSIEAPRSADGGQTVWLLDEHGDPLVSVRVTRGMTRVEVGRSCRTLDAR